MSGGGRSNQELAEELTTSGGGEGEKSADQEQLAQVALDLVLGEDPAVNPKTIANASYQRTGGVLATQGARDAAAIDPSDVLQGSGVGDCWFLAAMIAVARANPAAIEKIIQPLGDGLYRVTLHIYDRETKTNIPRSVVVDDRVPVRPNNTQDPYPYAHTDGDRDAEGHTELWPMLIEKAAALLLPGVKTTTGVTEGYESLHSGLSLRGLTILTGDAPERLRVGEIADPVATISAALAAHRPIATGAESKAGDRQLTAYRVEGQELLGGHAYAIVGVEGGRIVFQNPYGGYVRLSVATVRDFFAWIYIGAPL